MDLDLGGSGGQISLYWPLAVTLLCVAVVVWTLLRRIRQLKVERRRERGLREELEAYARLDARPSENNGDVHALGKRVSRIVAEVSAFRGRRCSPGTPRAGCL